MECEAKHTKYQPTDEEWKCPKCGAKVGTFCIDDPDPTASEGCEKLHICDELYCSECDYNINGKAFANKVAKFKNLVKCPHCKGTGWLPGKEKT